MERKYHYEYEVRCNNLCWGGLLIGHAKRYEDAYTMGAQSGKGAFIVRRVRVYEKTNHV